MPSNQGFGGDDRAVLYTAASNVQALTKDMDSICKKYDELEKRTRSLETWRNILFGAALTSGSTVGGLLIKMFSHP